MAAGALELEDGVAVPIEAEPAHPVEDRVDRRLGRARAIGILDAQQELAAVMAREQPVEQRRARAADMQIAGRRRRETGGTTVGDRATASKPGWKRHGIAVFLLMAAFGCALVWGRSAYVAAPKLTRPTVAEVSGVVERIERLPAREVVRLTIAPSPATQSNPTRSLRAEFEPAENAVEKFSASSNRTEVSVPLPRARVTIDQDKVPPGLAVGATVVLRARLVPPPGPALPGAYDFARVAWFRGIGATGKALGPVTIAVPAPAGRSLPTWLADARERLTRHIQSRLAGSEGGIAAAFVTGDVGAISEEDSDAMRRSGLAHLLSISGLHVTAVIAGTMLLTLRLLALSQWLALRAPLLLISAGAGALAGIAYTLLSGAEVPTVRSCVASLLVLGGIALGREALTLRLIATGAMIVLLWRPEALSGPSFQLSFAAVTAIVAFHELPRVRAWALARDEGLLRRLLRELASLLATGFLVEIALMPIAAYHFHRAGIYGALANIVAIPLTTFVVMPLEALALLFDLAGLGTPFWWLAGKGLTLLVWLARTIAAAPGAVTALPSMPQGAFLLMVGGGLWLALWRTRIRLAGLLPLAIGAAWALATPAPDLMITGDGRHLAIRTPDGVLYLLRPRAGDYVRQQFGEGAGVEDPALDLDSLPGARCNRDLCTASLGTWRLLATRSFYLVDTSQLRRACTNADIVVSDRRLPPGCRPRWLKADADLLRKTGGLAINFKGPTVRTVTGNDSHPWLIQDAATQQRGGQISRLRTKTGHEYEQTSFRSDRSAQMRGGDIQPHGGQPGPPHPLHAP
jgi:competence protein ComEC